ncbi:MAG: Mrp/NBP35 family ATP-binding protein [Alphaproteobacteria bacterium]|nr:Mrp/NBP35 family ATP-binding protein [Alphaproteobacteria bacterium]
MSLESRIINSLKTLLDPLSHQDIVTGGVLQGLQVTEWGNVSFILDINTQYMNEGIKLKEKAETLVSKIPGVKDVKVILTAQRKAPAPRSLKKEVPGIKHIVVLASGKGGVGKSTTAVNLACALHKMGLSVGILDCDVYGPSLPRLLGVNEKPTSDDGKIINPLEAYGLKCMSMGFMMDEKAPAIWRGPMVQSAVQQMLHQVKWGALDFLIVDLPPGTGDVQLTLAQSVLLSGAIIVSTPQDLALIDARKALEMFVKVDVPILGLVENMSFFLCPHCSGRSEIFEHGGVHRQALSLNLPLLAEIPLHMSIRETSEKGTPLVYSMPTSGEALLYGKLAKHVLSILYK